MRELKFRVYIPDRKAFEYFELGKFYLSDNYLFQHKYPVQQYTGLKDSKGKEIYEGDVLRADHWIFNPKTEKYEIYRENAICHIWYANPCSYIAEWAVSFNHLYSESSCQFQDLRNVEVIGNIFENADLLN